MDPSETGPILRDIHLPPPPGWWPPAPGWWIVAALALAVLVFLVWFGARVQRRRHRRWLALDELAAIRGDWLQHGDATRFAAALSNYLRRLGRVVDPSSATLDGVAWLAFLDRHGDGFREAGRPLLDAPFRPHMEFDADALYALIERHARRVVMRELAHV